MDGPAVGSINGRGGSGARFLDCDNGDPAGLATHWTRLDTCGAHDRLINQRRVARDHFLRKEAGHPIPGGPPKAPFSE